MNKGKENQNKDKKILDTTPDIINCEEGEKIQEKKENSDIKVEDIKDEKSCETVEMSDEDNQNVIGEEQKKDGFFHKIGNGFLKVGKTLWNWTKRTFMGASRELTDEDKFSVEKIDSPLKLRVKSFFSRKLAVFALVVLVGLFLFVFIAPVFIPLDINYKDPTQKSVKPCLSMRSVPGKLKHQIKQISGYSQFTMGLGEDGKIYMWGDSYDKLLKIDFSKFPDVVKQEKVAFIGAGLDHAIAITETGKVVGWGNKMNGQYGGEESLGVHPMPDQLVNGTIDPSSVNQLECGYQGSAIVMNDGNVYAWGNTNTIYNIVELSKQTNVKKVAFTRASGVALKKDGTVYLGEGFDNIYKDGKEINGMSLKSFLSDKKVVDIASTNDSVSLLLEDGELILSGVPTYNENIVPKLEEGEYFTKITGSSKHMGGVTNMNRAFSWGLNNYGQSDVKGYKNAEDVYLGGLQTYVIGEEGNLLKSFGFKGYVMGTDKDGRDVFTRIIHGGKMTMTIGAIAVIISTIIAIIVGCLSGYFGGWVDMLLMRVTEIFSSIPFLPFAMLLSTIVSHYPIPANTKIFIIMVILGLLSWPGLAKMVRGQVLAEREKEFVLAAKAMGVKEGKIAFKHILPNIISVVLVSITLDFAGCLLTESSLSYLGFGVQEPQPTWGNMLNGSNSSIVIQNYWWQWLFPALFLMTATICINIIGDTLRDVMDPKSSIEK